MKSFANKFFQDPKGLFLLGAIFFSLSFILRWYSLNQTEFGNGWDSYFYMVQIQSWQQTGQMHSPEWTLLYPLIALVDLFSPHYIISIKIVAPLLAALFSLMAFLATWQVRSSITAASFVASFTLFSPELSYFAAQWPKNLLGVVLLLALLLSLWKGNRKWIFILLILGFFGHRMTALLGVIMFSIWIMRAYLNKKAIMGIIGLLAFAILIGQFFPGVLNLKDWQRLSNLFSASPQFPIFSFYQFMGIEKISIYWNTEIWICLILIILGLIKIFNTANQPSKQALLALLTLIVILWLPFYYWEISGAAYRFFHVGVLLAPALFIFLLPNGAKLTLAGSTALLLLSLLSWKSYQPKIHDPDYEGYDLLTKRTQSQLLKNSIEPELIIAQKSLAEFYTFTTQTDAMPWIPEYAIHPEKLWRIAFLPYPKLFEFHVSEKPLRLGLNYFLVKEKQWQQFVKALKTKESEELVNEHLTWQNPNMMRPAFLVKK